MNEELKEAFAKLEAAIQKQWGDIPKEILEEFNDISLLIDPPKETDGDAEGSAD